MHIQFVRATSHSQRHRKNMYVRNSYAAHLDTYVRSLHSYFLSIIQYVILWRCVYSYEGSHARALFSYDSCRWSFLCMVLWRMNVLWFRCMFLMSLMFSIYAFLILVVVSGAPTIFDVWFLCVFSYVHLGLSLVHTSSRSIHRRTAIHAFSVALLLVQHVHVEWVRIARKK